MLPIIVCTIVAYAILFLDIGGNSIVAGIIVGIIAVTGSFMGLMIQFKKDSNINGAVESDISEMKSRLEHIDYNTKDLTETVLREMYPDLKNVAKDIAESKDNIAYIQTEFEFQKELKKHYSSNLYKDMLTKEKDSAYEKNAILENQHKEKSQELTILQHKAHNLELDNARLQEQVQSYEQELGKDDTDRGMNL